MIDPINPRHLAQIARIDAVENGDIDAIFIGIGAALVVGVDAADLAEPMFRRMAAELI